MKNLSYITHEYDGSVSYGEWDDTPFEKSILPTYYAKLPSDLQVAIEEVGKHTYSVAYNAGSSRFQAFRSLLTHKSKLFLFSPSEVGVKNSNTNSSQVQLEDYTDPTYAYYNGIGTTVKLTKNGGGEVGEWFDRSYNVNGTSHTIINKNGYLDTSGVRFVNAYICFGFCV
jgi:hypothetical protein